MGKLQFSEPLYCTHSSLSYFAYKKQFPPLLIYKEKTTNTLNSKKKTSAELHPTGFHRQLSYQSLYMRKSRVRSGWGGMVPIAKFKQLIMKIHVVLDPLRIHFIPTLPNYSGSAHAVPMVKGPKTNRVQILLVFFYVYI